MVDAAEEAGKHESAAGALRMVLRLFPEQATVGMQYRLARLESVGASPGDKAERYAAAARVEEDPLLARAAAADAAYYRALEDMQ
jgi:hypothetical protein